jgi:hypothetical protein
LAFDDSDGFATSVIRCSQAKPCQFQFHPFLLATIGIRGWRIIQSVLDLALRLGRESIEESLECFDRSAESSTYPDRFQGHASSIIGYTASLCPP